MPSKKIVEGTEDLRGSEEIERLADHVIEMMQKYADHPLVFVRAVVIVPALVSAYAKGAEIGGEYARKEGYDEGYSTGQRDIIDGGGP